MAGRLNMLVTVLLKFDMTMLMLNMTVMTLAKSDVMMFKLNMTVVYLALLATVRTLARFLQNGMMVLQVNVARVNLTRLLEHGRMVRELQAIRDGSGGAWLLFLFVFLGALPWTESFEPFR